MLKLLILTFIIVYTMLLISKFCEIWKITSCEQVLLDFLKNPTSEDKINAALQKYPDISDFLKYIYSHSLSYQNSPNENYNEAKVIYNDLCMKHNFLIKEFKQLFNPIYAFKQLIIFPVTVLKWIGFKPNRFLSLFLTVAGWCISYFLGMFQDEIKEILITVFQNFIK